MVDILELIRVLSDNMEPDEAATVKAGKGIAEQLFGCKFPDIQNPKVAGPLWVGILTHTADEAVIALNIYRTIISN